MRVVDATWRRWRRGRYDIDTPTQRGISLVSSEELGINEGRCGLVLQRLMIGMVAALTLNLEPRTTEAMLLCVVASTHFYLSMSLP